MIGEQNGLGEKLRNFLVLLFNTRRDVPKVVEYDLHHNNNTDQPKHFNCDFYVCCF